MRMYELSPEGPRTPEAKTATEPGVTPAPQPVWRTMLRRWLVRGASGFIAYGAAAKRYLESLGANEGCHVLLAQGYQDLTGQIIRGVMKLVAELETALANLARLSGDVVEHATLGESPTAGVGPDVPGVTKGDVASGQTDVDALLSGLGM